jgi:hypothetical protein
MRKCIALCAMGAALLAGQFVAVDAEATVADVSISFNGSAQGKAGDKPRYSIVFRVPQGFYGGNDEIAIDGPTGIQFPPMGNGGDRNYYIQANNTNYNILGTVSVQSSGNGTRVWIAPKNPNLGLPVNGWMEVMIGGIGGADPNKWNPVNPTVAGNHQLAVLTTRDAWGWSSFKIVAADPSVLVVAGGSGQRAFARETFEPLAVRVRDQYGNPVAGKTVRFALPEEGPSGEFEGGGRTAEVQTDGDGNATSPPILASDETGSWQATATLPDAPLVGPANFQLENLQRGAKAIEVFVDPPSLVADGVATGDATASLIDALDEPLSGQRLEVEVEGDVRVGAVSDNGDGTYTVPLAAGITPGEARITVRDPESGVAGTATFELLADAGRPKARITAKPRKRLRAKRAKRVRFRFTSGAADLAGFECKLDKRRWRACASPARYRVKRGRHRFAVRAFDLAGNRGPAASARFRVVKR